MVEALEGGRREAEDGGVGNEGAGQDRGSCLLGVCRRSEKGCMVGEVETCRLGLIVQVVAGVGGGCICHEWLQVCMDPPWAIIGALHLCAEGFGG